MYVISITLLSFIYLTRSHTVVSWPRSLFVCFFCFILFLGVGGGGWVAVEKMIALNQLPKSGLTIGVDSKHFSDSNIPTIRCSEIPASCSNPRSRVLTRALGSCVGIP